MLRLAAALERASEHLLAAAIVAMESAGITLVQGDLRGIVRARHPSRATMRNIRQNLFLAFVYNALGVPVAAGALYPVAGVLLNPMLAAVAMSLRAPSPSSAMRSARGKRNCRRPLTK